MANETSRVERGGGGRESADMWALPEIVIQSISRAVGVIDTATPERSAHSAYHQSVSPHLVTALNAIDSAMNLDCSHLYVRDIHDPEKLVVSTSSAEPTLFGRERFSAGSPFLRELSGSFAGQPIPLTRRRYKYDRLWELLWDTMTMGPYTPPWSIIGFPLKPAQTSVQSARMASKQGASPEALGFVVFVGAQGWYSDLSSAAQDLFPRLASLFALAGQVVRGAARFATLTDWTSPALAGELATAGKLHGVLAPLQRLELSLAVAESLLQRSRPRREVLSCFHEMRSEIFDTKRCVKDFLDTRAMASSSQADARMNRKEYCDAKRIVLKAIDDMRELAEARKKTVVFRGDLVPSLAISAGDFELIITNLIHNAIKYGANHTKIRVNCERQGSKVFLDVTSYGIGITASERERIFEPGYRTAEASRIEFTAAGLGLFSARRVAERWGGNLFLRTAGTTCDINDTTHDIALSGMCTSSFRLIVPC